jgi:hypothetical protein
VEGLWFEAGVGGVVVSMVFTSSVACQESSASQAFRALVLLQSSFSFSAI